MAICARTYRGGKMICYKDMTFCHSWNSCKKGDDCPRAITDDVLVKAEEVGLPLCIAEEFDCYEEKEGR